MWIHGLRSGPPASSSSTRYLPDSLSRPATAQPAEPAPVTMKSKDSAAPATISPALRVLPPVFADRLCSPDDQLPHLRVGVAGRRIQRAAARRARLVRHRAMGAAGNR